MSCSHHAHGLELQKWVCPTKVQTLSVYNSGMMKKLLYNILRCQHRAALGAASEGFGLVGSAALAFHVHHPAEAQVHIHGLTAAVAVERSLAEDTDAVVPFKLLAALVAMYLA